VVKVRAGASAAMTSPLTPLLRGEGNPAQRDWP
jgi:hypothetical protein